MDVLITSAGRRTSLVEAFRAASHARGGVVVAGDVDPLAPALFLADRALRTPPVDRADYIETLVDAVTTGGIGLIIPTIDTELAILAEHRATLMAAGCRPIVSAPSFIEITADKHRTGQAFEAAGFAVPRSWLPPLRAAELPEMVIVKPRTGSASLHVHRIPSHLTDGILPLVPGPIVQEVLSGPEITIDALLGLDGRPLHYVPRRRIKTVGGESIQGVTLDHEPSLERWIERLLVACAERGAIGPITIQAFLTSDGPVLTEINPRFGGGFPLAVAAGGDYPAWLLDLAAGGTIEPSLGRYESGIYMTRYHVERFTRSGAW